MRALVLGLVSVLSSACLLNLSDRDSDREQPPELLSFDLTAPSPGAQIRPGTEATLLVTGYELDEVMIQIVRISEGQESVIDTEQLRTDHAQDLETAHFSWRVRGDFLTQPGRSELFFRASVPGQTLRSDSFYVEVEAPQLLSIGLVGRQSEAPLRPQQEVTVQVQGQEVWGQRVTVEIFEAQTSSTSSSAPALGDRVDRLFMSFNDELLAQRDWTVDGDFADTLGTSALIFVASFGEQQLRSEPVDVEVLYTLDEAQVFAVRPSGTRQALNRGQEAELREFDALTVELKGSGLSQRTITIETVLDDRVVLMTRELVAQSDELEFTYPIHPDDFTAGGTMSVEFSIRVESIEQKTEPVVLRRWGIDRCAWFLAANDRPLGAGEKLLRGAEVVLRAQTWGPLEGAIGEFVLWEEDPGSDDLVDRFSSQVQEGMIERNWVSFYQGDGVLQDTNEYYFLLNIEDVSCRSPQLKIQE